MKIDDSYNSDLYRIVEDVVDYCRRFGITETTAGQCYEFLFSDVMDK